MLIDSRQRPLKDLRISVTDRCNFRCTYCMPLDEYEWIHKKEILTFEEIIRLARLSIELGVRKIHLTGGEPLVRQDLALLIEQLVALPGLKDVCLTTNGALLSKRIDGLKKAGLRRLNISLDALDPDRFNRMTQRGDLRRVLDGIFAAKRAGMAPIKLNAVIERGVNEDEIIPLVEFAREYGFVMRFIEYMDVGNTNRWTSTKLVSKKAILERIHARYPLREAGRRHGVAPAVDYEFLDGRGAVGLIASVTEPFCAGCTRLRLTADGKFVTCLFSRIGHDVKDLLRGDATDDEIRAFLAALWRLRTDRYSIERLQALNSAGYDPKSRRKIEMISLGG